MDKNRAIKILMASACCANCLCKDCPWEHTDDCKYIDFTDELIIDAIDTIKGNVMRTMKLSDIKIKESFANTTPKFEKMETCRSCWRRWHRQDRYIVVNHNNELIDGYVQYLILKEFEIEDAQVKISDKRKKRWYRKNTNDWNIPHYKNEETMYVYSIHPNSKNKREYVWRVPKSWTSIAENIQIGDTIFCQTKYGLSPVVVSKIEVLDKCPTELRVRRVGRKAIRRNGMVVEL